jgi:hypothetical protein
VTRQGRQPVAGSWLPRWRGRRDRGCSDGTQPPPPPPVVCNPAPGVICTVAGTGIAGGGADVWRRSPHAHLHRT